MKSQSLIKKLTFYKKNPCKVLSIILAIRDEEEGPLESIAWFPQDFVKGFE